jgi:hypothetical protein
MARSLFLRGLAVVYLFAFLSLAPQIDGLVGVRGILPARDHLVNLHSAFGTSAYWTFPTLAWLNSTDAFQQIMVWSGVVLALALLAGVMPFPAVIGLYVLYLSLDTIGQTFLSFQWDALLLEAGFAAILVTPFGIRPAYLQPTSPVGMWVLRLLIFRLMFESGLVKLLSGDPTWRGLTALNFHYETQPLPTPPAWYAHHLPPFIQKASVLAVFAVELVVPFLFLMPRKFRIAGAWITIVFQLLIAFTGNYTFFNLLTIVLCIPLFADLDFRKGPRIRWPWVSMPLAAVLAGFGLFQLVTMLAGPVALPQPFRAIEDQVQALRAVNRYGLFAVMTTSRPEIVVEGSDDGSNWRAYEFKYKPGDVNRPLPWIAPYQPRLDWQMWFAALSTHQDAPWFSNLVLRLLEGSPEVLALLVTNPFPDKPPQFVRASTYDYHFTGAERRSTGAIWRREFIGEYFPVVSLRQ